jgi:hypothetical protein
VTGYACARAAFVPQSRDYGEPWAAARQAKGAKVLLLPTEPRITPIPTTMEIPLDSRQNLAGEIACQRNHCPGKAEQVFTRQTIARR